MTGRRRKHWGWGYEDEQPSSSQLRAQAAAISAHLGFGSSDVEEPVALEQVRLPPPRLRTPRELAEICSTDQHARCSHALGKSYRDVVAGFRGRFEHPPDLVAFPRSEREVEALLQWCADANAAAIPYGGGTSVVGGVEARIDSGAYAGAVSIDLAGLGGVLEVDPISRAARIGAGASGPALEAELAAQGLTLRHFPQSFELSTLGGWIATRAAGHFATLTTHIEDMIESARAITPSGLWESRRLPGSGAGPSPDRMLAGSEGILGIVTEAWVRVRPRPTHRAQAAVRLPADLMRSAECVRELSQSGLHPANCRLIDAQEAALTGAGDGSHAVLLLAFESHDHEVDHLADRALAICAAHGGQWDTVRRRGPDQAGSSGGESGAGHAGGPGGAAGRRAAGGTDAGGGDAGGRGTAGRGAAGGADAASAWRQAFFGAPYLRDAFVAMGILSETFETAITWERWPSLHATVCEAAAQALREGGCEPDRQKVSCRITHVYPDGPAPYFTVLAAADRGAEIEQWQRVKAAVSEAVIAAGATITHHHAVGRDHRPWYDRQRPDPFAAALRGAKAALDPRGIMNPGVLIDPATGGP